MQLRLFAKRRVQLEQQFQIAWRDDTMEWADALGPTTIIARTNTGMAHGKGNRAQQVTNPLRVPEMVKIGMVLVTMRRFV